MQYSNVEVLEAASNFDLVRLEDLKAFLSVTSDADDARLKLLITLGSRLVADYCDRVFALEKVKETIVVDTPTDEGAVVAGYFGMALSRWPVVELTSFQQDGAEIDYVLNEKAGILRGNVIGESVITYRAGYVLPDEAPAPLSMAVMDWVRSSYSSGSRDPMIQSITDIASGSVRFFPPPGVSTSRGGGGGSSNPQSRIAFSPTATALLSQYKRPGMA